MYVVFRFFFCLFGFVGIGEFYGLCCYVLFLDFFWIWEDSFVCWFCGWCYFCWNVLYFVVIMFCCLFVFFLWYWFGFLLCVVICFVDYVVLWVYVVGLLVFWKCIFVFRVIECCVMVWIVFFCWWYGVDDSDCN